MNSKKKKLNEYESYKKYRKYVRKITKSKKQKGITVKCPKCEILHKVEMFWAGKGIPRIFCHNCKMTIDYKRDLQYEFPDLKRIYNESKNEV